MNKYDEIVSEIAKIKLKNNISMQDVEMLSACYGAIQALSLGEGTPQAKMTAEESNMLNEYMLNRSLHNFKKLCLDIQEFCQSVYVLTTNEDERKIFFDMVGKLNQLKT